MGVARTVYIRRAVSRVLSSSSLHATSCILFGILTSTPFPPFPVFPLYLRIGDTCLAPPFPVRHVRLTLSVLVGHVRPTLSICLSDTSVRRCPSPCPTRPSDIVRSSPTHLSDAVRLSVRHVRLTLLVSVSRSHSRSRSRSHSLPVPVPIPVPFPFRFPFPPPLPLPLSLTSPELTRVPWRTAAITLGCIFYSNLLVMSLEPMDTDASGSTLE